MGRKESEAEVCEILREHCHVPDKYFPCRLDNSERRAEFPKLVPYLKKYLAEILPSLRATSEDLGLGSLPAQLNSESLGLFFTGPVGTGKTHLAIAVMAELVAHNFAGPFISVSDFLVRCQTSWPLQYRYSRDKEWPEYVEAPDFVSDAVRKATWGWYSLLDDLGLERPTPFTQQMLDMLIEKIYSNQGLLIVTSNLSLGQLAKLYPRIADRIAETCQILALQADSYRMMKAQRRMVSLNHG